MGVNNVFFDRGKIPNLFLSRPLWIFFICFFLGTCLLFISSTALARSIRISILMASDMRFEPVNGLKDALVTHAREENHTFFYELKNAGGDRKKLPSLAAEIIAETPDIAVAGGGIEADALLAASQGTKIPVIFLSVSSSVDRGIVASLISSGNNFTGIDTNDTNLTAKRLWFIRKLFPYAKNIFCFHVPSIVPSCQSIAVARKSAQELGFKLHVAAVETEADIRKAADDLSRESIDIILQLPVAPIDRVLGSIIFPRALAENIPIFGYGQAGIQSGAFGSYGSSRYANGRQAARLVHKIINGIAPVIFRWKPLKPWS